MYYIGLIAFPLFGVFKALIFIIEIIIEICVFLPVRPLSDITKLEYDELFNHVCSSLHTCYQSNINVVVLYRQ